MPTLRLHPNPRRAFILCALGAAVIPGRASGQESTAQPKTPETKVPQTPEEHFARADEYERKAREYRQEASLHKKMLHDELDALPAKLRSGVVPGWVAKMRKHCEAYIRDSEALAREADRFAEYHRMRGNEMQGQ